MKLERKAALITGAAAQIRDAGGKAFGVTMDETNEDRINAGFAAVASKWLVCAVAKAGSCEQVERVRPQALRKMAAVENALPLG